MTLTVFFVLIIAELFLGGGGRLLEVGALTARMLFFAGALALTLLPQFWRRTSTPMPLALGLVLLFFAVHLPAVMLGLVRQNDAAAVLGELQPLLYILMAPFFARMLSEKRYVDLTAVVVRAAGVLMSLAYLSLLAGVLLGLFNFLSVFGALSATGEFFFRGREGLFVFKGFLYLCVALMFLLALKGPANRWFIALVAAAIVLTLTRGFIFSSLIAAIFLLWMMGKRRLVGMAVGVALLIGVIVVTGASLFETGLFMRNTESSNAARLKDIIYMLENVDALTLVFGHGFGSLISGSRLNIENSYLWIWWKAGLAGLLFWFIPLVLCAASFRKIPAAAPHYPMACAYFFSVVLIYLQTATNPYLTNPIGLSFVLIAIFALRTLSREAAEEVPHGCAGLPRLVTAVSP